MSFRKKVGAFTLIECLIACTLIACIALLSFSYTKFLHHSLVKNELYTLHATCLYLQQRALATGRPQTLSCDTHTHSYQYNDSRRLFPRSMQFHNPPEVKGPPSKPITVPSSAVTFAKNSITFHPDGVVSPGTLYVTDISSKRVFALSISVAQVSLIRLYEYHNTKWHLIR